METFYTLPRNLTKSLIQALFQALWGDDLQAAAQAHTHTHTHLLVAECDECREEHGMLVCEPQQGLGRSVGKENQGPDLSDQGPDLSEQVSRIVTSRSKPLPRGVVCARAHARAS